MTASRTTEALIRNAIEACKAAGLDVGAVEVSKGGVVRVLPAGAISTHPAPEGENTCDKLFGGRSG